LNAAHAALAELQLDYLPLAAVAKGHQRKAGRERIFLRGSDTPVAMGADSPALHLIQEIRDEAHRFAITGHRQRRGNARKQSSLETIAGLGPKRRRALLQHFGGLQAVAKAGIKDLAGVHGISADLAQRVHDYFHSGNH
jgi:excinuclease ABC subunit C